jgi:hypothetical protein
VTGDERDRAAKLLLSALQTLTERDRDLVLRHILAGRVGRFGTEPWGPPEISFASGPTSGLGIARQLEQPLLVRLPTDLHGRLRQWATAHGFSMAGIVRGLIERFLDQQEGGQAAKAD